MPSVPILVSLLAAGGFPEAVQAHLQRAAPGWLDQYGPVIQAAVKGPTVGVVELSVRPDGAVERLGLARSSGRNDCDDLVRLFVLAAEPLPAPSKADLTDGRRATCLVRVGLERKALDPAVACFAAQATLPKVIGLTQGAANSPDAGAQLFAGWVNEQSGQLEGAATLYQRAVQGARDWDYAARAYGLLLVRAKRYEDAIPFLQVYLENREAPTDVATYAREIKRFAKYQETQGASRKRLSKQDLAAGIADGFDALEACLEGARADGKLAVGTDTLIMSWKIRPDGSVTSTRLDGPAALVMTAHAECLEQAVAGWSFPSFSEGGEEAVNKIPLKVRGRDPKAPPPPTTVARADIPLSDEKPSMTTCQRGQTEIFDHIRSKMGALNRCVDAERNRMPNTTLPDTLPIRFVIEGAGRIRAIEVDHRHYRTGPMATCVAEALAGTLPPAGEADCPAQFELNLR